MAVNRTEAPEIQVVEKINLPQVDVIKLDNGIPVYSICAGEQEVVKIEMLFKAGKWYESGNLEADFTNRLLREGTQTHTALQLAEAFDFFGANVNYGASFETAGAILYSLSRNVHEVLPYLFEVFTQPVFPQNELETVLNNRKQRLKVELEKNDFVSNRLFVNALFGQQHPYGRVTEFEHFDAINTDKLKEFFARQYTPENLVIIISGKFGNSLIKQLNETFGSIPASAAKAKSEMQHTCSPSDNLWHRVDKKESVQTSLVLGNHAINKLHPDFLKLSILNTLFGGYFGSRLMSNIREEKGYTYGIYSSFVSYPHAGFLEISTEVGKEVYEDTLKEIEFEINRLKTEEVSEEELTTVKNYMGGKILRSIDGPMKYSETLKGLILYNQQPTYIHDLLHTVRTITPHDIQQLANTYLHYDKMYKVAVG